MDEIELLLVNPQVLRIIDYEFEIWWDPRFIRNVGRVYNVETEIHCRLRRAQISAKHFTLRMLVSWEKVSSLQSLLRKDR